MRRSGSAIRKLQECARLTTAGGPINDWEAGRLELQAQAHLMVDESALVSSHGEAVLADVADVSTRHWSFIETLKQPNMIAVDASEHRLDRVQDAGVLELAVDAVESVQAENSIEKMLVHQMALAHDTAMRLLPKAIEQREPANMTKYVNAAARLMDIYREGMLAVYRMKLAAGRPSRFSTFTLLTAVKRSWELYRGRPGAQGGAKMKTQQEPHANQCGAKTRSGHPCRNRRMPNGRCRMHGGKSSGAKTSEGRARIAAARLIHGRFTAQAKEDASEVRTVIRTLRQLLS